MEKDREKLLSLGFNDFIGKPIKPSELIDKICKITNY
jgi:CheY-like chemotaxis protein